MAFCKVIAIYQEPIYLQFASGREGAAGGGKENWEGGRERGLEGLLDVYFLPIDHCLVHRLLLKEIIC